MEFDRAADDFAVHPWLYPGGPATTSGVLAQGRFVALDADPGGLASVLAGVGEAPLQERTLVVAIGSNVSPAVLFRKFTTRGVSTCVPFLTGVVDGLAVGHSAHVSVPGYVPAAPFRSAGASTPVVASWLDAGQLRALDETEPTYRRLDVPSDAIPLRLSHGPPPRSYALYVSRRGLFAPDGRTPAPLMPQREILPTLYRYITHDSVHDGPDAVMKMLAENRELREEIRRRLAEDGLVAPSGLGGEDPALATGN